jgi:hypothetical protein
MHRGPAARAGQAVRGLAVRGLAVRGLAVRGLAVRDLVAPADRVGLDRVGLDPVVRDPVGLADQADIRDRVDLDRADRVDLDLVGREDIRDRAGRVDLDLVDPADLAVLDRVDQGMNRADQVGLADLDRVDQGMNRSDPVGRVGLADLDLVALGGRADLAVRLDRQQRRTHPGVLSTGVAPRWAAPGMRRTASARPATVRRLRRHHTDGAGMAGLHPERRRLSGTDRRPRVAGAVLRLPAVGTAHGTVRRAISQWRRPISGRSITTAITRSRCSTQFLGDGASGSSVSGSRCTEKLKTPGLRILLLQVRRPGGACSDSTNA